MWIDVDTKNAKPYRQVEIRRPSEKGYYYNVVWLKDVSVKKGDAFTDKEGHRWTIAELYGIRNM